MAWDDDMRVRKSTEQLAVYLGLQLNNQSTQQVLITGFSTMQHCPTSWRYCYQHRHWDSSKTRCIDNNSTQNTVLLLMPICFQHGTFSTWYIIRSHDFSTLQTMMKVHCLWRIIPVTITWNKDIKSRFTENTNWESRITGRQWSRITGINISPSQTSQVTKNKFRPITGHGFTLWGPPSNEVTV
jgi:hypothetical protein